MTPALRAVAKQLTPDRILQEWTETHYNATAFIAFRPDPHRAAIRVVSYDPHRYSARDVATDCGHPSGTPFFTVHLLHNATSIPDIVLRAVY